MTCTPCWLVPSDLQQFWQVFRADGRDDSQQQEDNAHHKESLAAPCLQQLLAQHHGKAIHHDACFPSAGGVRQPQEDVLQRRTAPLEALERHALRQHERQNFPACRIGVARCDTNDAMLDRDIASPGRHAQRRCQWLYLRFLARLKLKLVDRLRVTLLQLRKRRGDDQAPLVEDGDSVADALDIAEDMRRHEDRRDAAHPGDDVQDLMPPRRIERAGRLIQKEDLRPVDERLSQPKPLAHPAGVAADAARCGVGQSGEGQNLVHPAAQRRSAQSEQLAYEREQLPSAHPAIVAWSLIKHADAFAQRHARARHVEAKHLRAPSRRRSLPRQQADEGGLARAIRPKQTEDRASWRIESQLVERDHRAVALAEARAGYRVLHAIPPRARRTDR